MDAGRCGLNDSRASTFSPAAGHGTLYIGVTSDPAGRLHQHREGLIAGFTRVYGIKRLVHYEMFGDMAAAIQREKRLKEWRRAWKIELIETRNPHWEDIALAWGFAPLSD